jgi:hypothetical protein
LYLFISKLLGSADTNVPFSVKYRTQQAKKVGPIIRKLAYTLNPADTRWQRFEESCTYLVAERLGRDESHLLDNPLK